MKTLKCRDVGFDCDAVVRADTDDEVMRQAAEHAKAQHGIHEITPEMGARVRALIRSE